MVKHALRLALVALLFLLAACGNDGDGGSTAGTEPDAAEESKASKFTIKTLEYAFQVQATSFKAGLVELTLDNTGGKESHEVEIARLDQGKTLDDYKKVDPAGPPPDWVEAAGGPGPVLPGKTAVYTANFEAGTYVLECHVPAPDGKEHASKGMITSVTATAGDEGELPEADATITASEFKFSGLEGLKAGEQVVRFENTGTQQHHAAMIALAPGKTAKDALAFFQAAQTGAPPAGPPPFTGFPGFMATFAPGAEATRTLNLTPGNYAIVCFIPDTDGVPHAAKGMAQDFTIS